MPFAEFTDDMRIGHADIDRQHAALYETVNRLHDAMRSDHSREVQGEILAFLHAYTVEHFEAEEALMRNHGYPGLASHKALHDGLVQQVKELEEKYTAGSMTLSIMTMHFLKDWLTHHILEEDRKMAEYLKGKE
jgi:hemerythrin-like metal-binding protein